tara:strand:+ start:905 stop:1468 length:564 start_codon:yes stop_codon:yes gene_type:complete
VFWDHHALEKEKSFIVVLVSFPSAYFYEKGDASDVFIKEICMTVRKHLKNSLIVLKLKPHNNPNVNRWVYEAIKSLGDSKIIMNNTPAPFLAEKASLVFMVSDTTACFDFLIREVPCIEHCRYSKGWLNVYPRGSWWRDVGVKRTTNVDELEQAIVKVKNGTFEVMRRDALINTIKHKENNEFFKTL